MAQNTHAPQSDKRREEERRFTAAGGELQVRREEMDATDMRGNKLERSSLTRIDVREILEHQPWTEGSLFGAACY